VEPIIAVWMLVGAFTSSALILGALFALFGGPSDPSPLEDDDVEVG
jgi:hypothetical protein